MRITKLEEHEFRRISRWTIEGRVAGEYASLLEQEYGSFSGEDRSRLCVNLEHVTFLDGKGIAVLVKMKRDGVLLEGVNPFISELIRRGKKPGQGK